MTKRSSVYIALIGAVLLVAASVSVWAQTAQQTGDQSQPNSSTAAKSTKKKKADAAVSSSQAALDSGTASAKKKTTTTPAAPASAPASKTATTQQAPPANSAGMVWVNTDSGIYHKPGTRWYGKTKQGKYMTEADAVKAGYKASGKN
jgi:cytoskeletal protein RodZ